MAKADVGNDDCYIIATSIDTNKFVGVKACHSDWIDASRVGTGCAVMLKPRRYRRGFAQIWTVMSPGLVEFKRICLY